MLDRREGFETVTERLHDKYDKGHVIARFYLECVTTGLPIKQNDLKALVKLKDGMLKFQSVLSMVKISSDLDCAATLKFDLERLPDCFFVRWARPAVKVL